MIHADQTIVQLIRVRASVFMSSAHSMKLEMRYEKLLEKESR